jgi:hypothetical protein
MESLKKAHNNIVPASHAKLIRNSHQMRRYLTPELSATKT